MSRVISYTSEENLMRVKMQKRTKFVVVEGEDDIPIYETIIHSLIDEELLNGLEVTFGGGKENIKKFLRREKCSNIIAMLDMDFDHNDRMIDDRLSYLDYYSIENYFFNKRVVSYLLANILRKNIKEVYTWLNMDTWYEHINEECLLCLKYLFYYQKMHSKDKNKWSDVFIAGDNGCWRIDKNKINRLVERIKSEIEVTDEVIQRYFDEAFPTYDCLTKVFPGKILFVSVYRYLKSYLEQDYPGVFGRNYTNDQAFKNATSPHLKFNTDLRRPFLPILRFIKGPSVVAC